jgi:hypothetical protein
MRITTRIRTNSRQERVLKSRQRERLSRLHCGSVLILPDNERVEWPEINHKENAKPLFRKQLSD